MLRQSDVAEILSEYVEAVVPAMLRRGYHLSLVKGGPEYPYLSEQSHFTHVVNGVFALARFLEFVLQQGVAPPRLNGSLLRKALALYTVHEGHKDRTVARGVSEFDIPLERLREEYRALGLEDFAAPVDDHLLRAANVHKRSTRHGDRLLTDDPDADFLWLLGRPAGAMASSQTPEEAARSLQGYLASLGPAFAPAAPPGRFALYFHELRDVRGVLTNAIHQAVARQLEAERGFFPLLYFATGTLYIGPAGAGASDAEALIPAVAGEIVQILAQAGGAAGLNDMIREGIRGQKYDFQPYVHAFAAVEDLLQVVYEDALRGEDPRVPKDTITDIAENRRTLPPDWLKTVEERLGIRLLDPKEHRAFNGLWSRAYRYLLFLDTLVRDLLPGENRLDWLLRTFEVPQPYADQLRQEADIWSLGGIGKYALVVAYHFLRGPDFADRPAATLPPAEGLNRLHRRALEALRQADTRAGREAKLAELGFRPDLEAYLWENLHLSFAPVNRLGEDGLTDTLKPKSRGHTGKVCSLCNRRSDYIQELTTGVLDDFGRVFSNRVLPRPAAPGGNRLWCPVCHLEFVLRKLVGIGLPRGAHYRNTRRIYLYVLPTYSFTPEHLRLFEPLLGPFRRPTNLPVRDYGGDPGLPRVWLEHRSFDPDWMEQVQDVLEREAEKIAGWGGQNYVGERVLMGEVRGQPHYYLIQWEKAARGQERDDARIATRTEAWAKALFAAVLLSGLTGCKGYVTERPYLPIADPNDLKATITLDGPPPVLRGLLGGRGDTVSLYGRERGSRSGLEHVLDLCAALWVVTAEVRALQRLTKDKQVAERLEAFNTSPLAGATFYKEYGRLNEGRSPHPLLAQACEILLNAQGGELMDLVEKIAQKSLEIVLPRGISGRGKARRYELLFREAVSAMRRAQQMIPEIRETAVGKGRPSPQSIAELKRLTAGTLLKALERRQQTWRGEVYVRAWGEELGRKVGEFVDLVVDELYLGRAGGSFARFLRLENAIADGIYYYTDRNLSRYWEETKREREIPESEPPEEV